MATWTRGGRPSTSQPPARSTTARANRRRSERAPAQACPAMRRRNGGIGVRTEDECEERAVWKLSEGGYAVRREGAGYIATSTDVPPGRLNGSTWRRSSRSPTRCMIASGPGGRSRRARERRSRRGCIRMYENVIKIPHIPCAKSTNSHVPTMIRANAIAPVLCRREPYQAKTACYHRAAHNRHSGYLYSARAMISCGAY